MNGSVELCCAVAVCCAASVGGTIAEQQKRATRRRELLIWRRPQRRRELLIWCFIAMAPGDGTEVQGRGRKWALLGTVTAVLPQCRRICASSARNCAGVTLRVGPRLS